MRIALFIPCYIDAFFPEVGIATLELLERFGHEVVYPPNQTCCGQPMTNTGRHNHHVTLLQHRFHASFVILASEATLGRTGNNTEDLMGG